MRFRVAVIGVTGYSGLELMKIVLQHPAMECLAVMASKTSTRKPLHEIHPQLCQPGLDCRPADPGYLAELAIDTAFLCTPNEVSYELVPKLLDKGIRVIDLSGSFRLRDAGSYASWYGFNHDEPQLLESAVYGLPEWKSGMISDARLVANPGCYPTSALLALLPLMNTETLELHGEIICDSKSGVTGAGRSVKVEMLFGEVSENFRAYTPMTHRHVPEICQELNWNSDNFIFVPHLLPINRGMLSTIYVCFKSPVSSEELEAEYRRRYDSHPFVRILGASRLPELRYITHTNFCDLAWRVVPSGQRAVIFSALDNLIKGAAGQAVQNFNLMHGLEETLGLERELGAIHN